MAARLIERGRLGIITPIAMHATFNTDRRFLAGLFVDTQPGTRIPFDLVMALCGLATALVLIVATRGALHTERRAGSVQMDW
jgi:crotonobetainyl-CoA:carnitine CoA-transferase CaiB-like acyl-CoA transferase